MLEKIGAYTIKEKALSVIKNKSFGVPQALTRDKMMSSTVAKEYIANEWPINEASELLENIQEVESFGHQSTMIRFTQEDHLFTISGFKQEGPARAKRQDVPWITNPFWENNIDAARLRQTKSSIGRDQNIYQEAYYELGMDRVYYLEVERYLKEKGLLKSHYSYILSDKFNKLTIVMLPEDKKVIVLAKIGQRASTRPSASYQLPIIFQTKDPQQLTDYLIKNKANGLNAIFTLINSDELSPKTPERFVRNEIFYVLENQTEDPFLIEAKLEETEILGTDNTSVIGKVKRLKSLKSS